MDIVVPSYSEHIVFMEKFLETFSMNCTDCADVTINIIVSDTEYDMFRGLANKFDKLNIKIHIMHNLLIKYDNIDFLNDVDNDEKLLQKVGKFTFQSLKKLYGSLETNNKYVCIFDSECLFIRKFKLKDYIDENKDRYFYCSKLMKNNITKDRANDMQCYTNTILDIVDRNWYLEMYLWILKRDILLELHKFLMSKYESLLLVNTELFVEYAYYEYYRNVLSEQTNDDTIEWIDTHQLLKDNLSKESYDRWKNGTYGWCMFEHIGRHLRTTNYKQMEEVKMIYETINLPIFRVFPNNKANQQFLLICPTIKICVSEYCSDVYEMTMKDIFNKRIGLFVSGLYRMRDNVNDLIQFVYPMTIDTYYYVSSENPDIYIILEKQRTTKSVFIDNTHHSNDVCKFKYVPPSKPTFVQNTIEMFYKKTQFIKYLDNYDIFVNIRPDLVSLDKDRNLIDITYDILRHYDDNIIYTPRLYDSVGIADTIAIGSNKVIRHYLNIYNDLRTIAQKYVFNPESIVYHQFTDNKITTIPFLWNYKINWHDKSLMDVTWRNETDKLLNYNFYDEFIRLKSISFETITMNFFQHTKNDTFKKYKFVHYKTGKCLYVREPNRTDCLCVVVDPTEFSQFNIVNSPDMLTRINIKLSGDYSNQNKTNSGWNIYTVPTSGEVFGRGDNGKWAQFYVEPENMHDKNVNLYNFVSFHSLNSQNQNGKFGRYLGYRNGKIMSDLPKSDDTIWNICVV